MLGIIAKNTIYQSLTRSITSFIGFIITIIIARNFGVIDYGDFTKVVSYVSIFYLFVDFGLNAIYLQDDKNSLKTYFSIRLILGLLFFTICNFIILLIPYSEINNVGFSNAVKLFIFVYSFTIFTQIVFYTASAYFQKILNYFGYMIALIIGAVANLLLVFIFTFLNFSIFYIFIAFLFGSFLTSILLIYLCKEKFVGYLLDKKEFKNIIFAALPLGLMLVFNFIYFRVDMFLLSALSSTQSVGVYGLSYKFFEFLIAIPLFLSNSIYPFLIKAKNNQQALFRLIGKYLKIFILLSVVISLMSWFMAPLFSFIRPEFSESSLPFRILLVSLPIFFITSLLQWVLITLEKQQYLMKVYFFGTIINIILNILLIPKYSYLATASITVFSEALVLAFLTYSLFNIKKNE